MRLATFNILNGRSPRDGVVDLDRFADAVRALDADVLALQEVDRAQVRSAGADLTAVAAEAMGAVAHRFAAAIAGTPGAAWVAATGDEQPDSAAYGVALLSRYPVRSWRIVRLPGLRGPVPMVFRGRRRPVLVTDEPRVAVAGLVEAPAGPMTAVSTHLSFLPGWNRRQLRHLARCLRDGDQPLVLMGDLNMEPPQAARCTGMRALATAPTYPLEGPGRQIDHILADGRVPSPALLGESVRLPMSDHRALLVDV